MVEFNKDPESATPKDFPIINDGEMSEQETRLRADLNRLIVIWQEAEELAYDIHNIQYAQGLAVCLEDLEELLARNART